MSQPQRVFRADDLQTPEETFQQVRERLGIAPETDDYTVFRECFEQAHGPKLTLWLARLRFEQYANYCVLKDPVDYELPAEILSVLTSN